MAANTAILQLQASLQHLRDLVFKTDADFYDLLTIACACAVFWFVVFSIGKTILQKLTGDKPSWLREGIEKELSRMGGAAEINKDLGLDYTDEEFVEILMDRWFGEQMVTSQHLFGGALCIPSQLGLGDPSWASSLAVLGILSEVGFEIQDVVILFYTRLRHGPKRVPTIILVLCLLHHSLASGLGIPTILRYREWWVIHSICFDLQFGTSLLAPLGEYGKLLNVKKPDDLHRFKIVNILKVIIGVWTRGIHFIYLVTLAMISWYNDKAWTFLCVGSPVLLAFTGFNYMMILKPVIKTYMKFRNASAEYEALPADASDEQKRKSLANLGDLARELIEETDIIHPTDQFTAFFQSLQERKGKLDRRQTMTPRQKMMSMRSMRSMRLTRGVSAPPRAWKID